MGNSSVAESGCRRHARKYELFSVGLVLALVVSDILDSCDSFHFTTERSLAFAIFQYSTCAVFTIEYLLRLWSCPELHEPHTRMEEKGEALIPILKPKPKSDFVLRLNYCFTPLPLVDLIVLTAFYIDFTTDINGHSLAVLRMVRLLRILALLKAERQANSFRAIFQVLILKKSELGATLFTASVLMVVSASLMYYLENEEQPEAFPNIPTSMWWAVTALTTVGYGDICPQSPGGKFVASVVAFFGVGLFALPAGILGSGFVEVIQDTLEEEVLEAVENEEEKIAAVEESIKQLQQSVADICKEMRLGFQEMREEMQCLKERK